MAFADTLLDESDAHMTIVDRHAKPGGHWNDAYSFVTLHAPSAYDGVNSTELGSRCNDDSGPNKGLYELAGGPEINTYFDTLMQQKFLPSGRVSYHPMSNYLGDGRIVSLLSGTETSVTVRMTPGAFTGIPYHLDLSPSVTLRLCNFEFGIVQSKTRKSKWLLPQLIPTTSSSAPAPRRWLSLTRCWKSSRTQPC